MPVDAFFRSLAAHSGSNAIGVILSGSASDGALGLREIKAAGGITLAQNPETASCDGMPRAAIATGIVDLVMSPKEIGGELASIASQPYLRRATGAVGATEVEDPAEPSAGQLQQIIQTVRRATGVDFSQYKTATIKRRLLRRMALHRITTVERYLRYLEESPGEVKLLFSDILINVTRFFRDPESFEALAKTVYPRIMDGRSVDQPVRVWVPGCSTGEEAYSIAMSMLEYLDETQGAPILVFASDLSEAAIERARKGVYPESIAADVNQDRLRRFFTRSDGSYRIRKTVRDLCVFARQDITADPPFSKLDLVVCRNVLIYLGPALQQRVLPVFHYALRPDGFLMLGSAESTGSQSDLFSVADKKHRIFRKREADSPYRLQARSVRTGKGIAAGAAAADPPGRGFLQNEVNRVVLERFSPPGVLVDESYRIVHVRGRTGPFLEASPGDANLSILKMAREGLLHSLRLLLHKAKVKNLPATKHGLRVGSSDQAQMIDLHVVPVPAGDTRHYLVLFEPHAGRDARGGKGAAGGKGVAGGKGAGPGKRPATTIRALEQELTANREYSQSIIQDLEATNEELQAANEEVLSSNEELQSTNEELDTAKEELQSTNEELSTVNEELHSRNEELSRVNSDLMNLLASVQIAIVMVSKDLRIRRFTPTAEKVLNLIATDIGRPISNINPNLDAPDLEERIREVIGTLAVHQRDVQDGRGKWYSLTIRPYMSVDDRIDGAVLALVDVDLAKRHEARVQQAQAYASAIVDSVRDLLIVLDPDLRVVSANRAFYRRFGTAPAETEGRLLYDLGNGQWDIPVLRSQVEAILQRDQQFDDFVVEDVFPGIGRRKMLLNGRRVEGADGRPALVLLAMQDITSPPAAGVSQAER
jgi:two-component system CheB/CheR fusion protein